MLLIAKAYEQKAEDVLIQRWIMNYQNMPFKEFKRQVIETTKMKDIRSKAEILSMTEGVLESFKEGR